MGRFNYIVSRYNSHDLLLEESEVSRTFSSAEQMMACLRDDAGDSLDPDQCQATVTFLKITERLYAKCVYVTEEFIRNTGVYLDALEKHDGELLSLSQFMGMSSSDGFGYPVCGDYVDSSNECSPEFWFLVPGDATGVMWFNR